MTEDTSPYVLRVMLVEDHTLVRAGIRALLQGLPDIQVVAEAADGLAALELIAADPPDVVLMDISMPGLSGLETAARLRQQASAPRVILLSMHASEEYVLQALQQGVSGYLLKDAGTSELTAAIRAVARGETYISPAVSKHLAGYIRRVGETSSGDGLTPRQREILKLIAEGRTTQQIAQQLHISVKTAETHRAQLMERLNIHDVAGLVRYAIRTGLVTPNE
jgi:DNA-binding NarL/FixJ family response regulator